MNTFWKVTVAHSCLQRASRLWEQMQRSQNIRTCVPTCISLLQGRPRSTEHQHALLSLNQNPAQFLGSCCQTKKKCLDWKTACAKTKKWTEVCQLFLLSDLRSTPANTYTKHLTKRQGHYFLFKYWQTLMIFSSIASGILSSSTQSYSAGLPSFSTEVNSFSCWLAKALSHW